VSQARLTDLVALLARRGQLADGGRDQPDASGDTTVGAIRHDSRRVRPGDVFVARPGQHADGHDHVPAAVAAGAVAVLVERPVGEAGVPQVVVRDARRALGLAAAWRAGDPSTRLGVIGITGTDGKTTTAYLVRAALEAAGRRTGLLGTTDVIVGGRSLGNAARTSTPEAPELQDHLAAMLAAGDTWAVIESTSHGLAQDRVAGIAYDVGVLTNITSEHLEFHGTIEAYRAAKHSLFERLAVSQENPEKGWGKHAVVNADDPQGEAAAATAATAGARVWRYGLARSRSTAGGLGPALDITASDVGEDHDGLRFRVAAPGWTGGMELRLAGRFNVHNALAAMAVATAVGLDPSDAAAALGQLEAVPGRMQRIDEGQPFSVIVDYAHTAEALATVLDELRPDAPGAGLIAVFGSAGERDTSKRPAMGRVAGQRCRLVVVTDEDPRGEDRLAILDAIARGAEATGRRRGEDLLVIPDRAEAIATAVERARPGDVVVLAGKGHETTIETAAGEVPWDEAEAARAALRARSSG
jgi:UDP-N-acetylmuramoyl-L-alanyl-D-glutamate--2,6-diaminopimelate ligase